jgi:hypothetical protein
VPDSRLQNQIADVLVIPAALTASVEMYSQRFIELG